MSKVSVEEAKIYIRSVLLPEREGLSLRDFRRAYQNTIGKDISYRDYGYDVLEDFLKSIPDVVAMQWNNAHRSYHLIGIADEKTNHIKRLVSKQKCSRRRSNSFTQRYKPSYAFSAVQRFDSKREFLVPRSSLFSKPMPLRLRKTCVSSILKDNIMRLVQDYNHGIKLSDIPWEYKQRYRVELNISNLGFSNISELLLLIPEVSICLINGVNKVFLTGKEDSQASEKPNNSGVADGAKPHNRESVTPTKWWDAQTSPSQDMSSCANSPDSVTGSQADKQLLISDVMKNHFSEILHANPDGIWTVDFLRKYKELTGYELKSKELGYHSLIALVNDLPDVFFRFRPAECKTDWLLYNAKTPKHEVLQSPCNSMKHLHPKEDIVCNIRKILQGHPEGVDVGEIFAVYMQNFQTSLMISEFGFRDLEQFLLSIADQVPLTIDGRRVKLHQDEYPPTVSPSMPSTSECVVQPPDDVALAGAKFILQELPASSEKCISVHLSHFISPDVFYIQLSGEPHNNLYDLMERMWDFYESNIGHTYKMLECHIAVGMVSAVSWDEDRAWYRSLITEISTDDNTVNICYVDYGTKAKVPQSQLYYLKSEFMEIPVQAIRAALPCILPKAEKYWGRHVAEFIIQFCKNKILMAEILGPADANRSIPMSLCDCTGEKDVFLTGLLVSENLASYSTLPSPKPHIQDLQIPSPIRSPKQAVPDSKSSWMLPNSQTSSVPLLGPLSVTIPQDPLEFPPIPPPVMCKQVSSFAVPSALSTTHPRPEASLHIRESHSAGAAQQISIPVTAPQPNVSVALQNGIVNAIQTVGLLMQNPVIMEKMSDNNHMFNWMIGTLKTAGFDLTQLNLGYLKTQLAHSCTSNATTTTNDFMSKYLECYLIASPSCSNGPVLHPMSFNDSTVQFKPTVSSHSHPPNPSPEMKQSAEPCHRLPSPTSSSDSSNSFVQEQDDDQLEIMCNQRTSLAENTFLKRVRLSGYIFHIVVLEQKPYISWNNIMGLIRDDQSNSNISINDNGIKLRKKLNLVVMTITDADHPEVFLELERCGALGKEQQETSIITLFHLKDMISILNFYGHPSPVIRYEMQKLMKRFNPNDNIWEYVIDETCNSEAEAPQSSRTVNNECDEIENMCMLDLKSGLEFLDFRRYSLSRQPPNAKNARKLKETEEKRQNYLRRMEQLQLKGPNRKVSLLKQVEL